MEDKKRKIYLTSPKQYVLSPVNANSSRRRSSDINRSRIFEKAAGLLEPMQQVALEMKGALLACGFAAMCYVLHWFKMVLIPFFLAIFLMYLVDPIVELIDVSPKYFCCFCTQTYRQRRRTSRGCSRAFASSCAVIIVCLFFAVICYVIVLSVNSLDMKAYQNGYSLVVTDIEAFTKRLGLDLNIKSTFKDNLDKVASIVLTDFIDFFSTIFVVIIYLTYFLCTRKRLSDIGGVWERVDQDIQRFVTLKAYLSLAVAILVTTVYVVLNVGLAIVWGILTFILNWIPNFGALIASALPLFIIVITPSEIMNPLEKFLAILLPASLHVFIGNFIEPRVFGNRLEMDPVVVILSLSCWGMLWGITGMMLSIPLTAAFKIFISHFKIWPSVVAILEGRVFDAGHDGGNPNNQTIEYSSLTNPVDDDEHELDYGIQEKTLNI